MDGCELVDDISLQALTVLQLTSTERHRVGHGSGWLDLELSGDAYESDVLLGGPLLGPSWTF